MKILDKRILLFLWPRTCSSIRKLSTTKRTALFNFHSSHGANMVPFAGWYMPAVYGGLSIVESVRHTRKKLSLFDVSHMLQSIVSGRDAALFLEGLVVSDIQLLQDTQGTLSLITNENGGIVDDCIITRTGAESFYVVSNASRSDVVTALLKKSMETFKDGAANVVISHLTERSLIALQGPMLSSLAKEVLRCDLSKLYFMRSAVMQVLGVDNCRVSRCGYTGEDGVEISVDSTKVVELCEKLMMCEEIKLAGLGCRDVLRTEAGLCLYGNELSESISPVEAGLSWCIGKSRKKDARFPGSSIILHHSPKTVPQRRIGLTSGGPVLRQGCEIVDDEGSVIGKVTSGCPSPTLGSNIAMAYVPPNMTKPGKEVKVMVRKNTINAVVTKLPFVKCNYYMQ